MAGLTAEQRLARARVSIIRNPRWQYLSGILMLGEHKVVNNIPTARTNGRDVEYGRKFLDTLTEDQIEGLVLHEAFHVMYKHLTVWERLYREDADTANKACDFVINLQITDEGHVLPPGGCISERFRGMDTLQVYRILRKEKQDGGGGKGTQNGQQGGDEGQGFDEHDWEGAQEMSTEEQESLAKEIDRALREGAMLAGKSDNAKRARELGELLAPKIDWREALREFVQNAVKGNDYSTWKRPNRRHMHSGLYLPTQLSDSMGHVVVGVDTSGSVDNDQLNAALSEITGITITVMPDRLDLIYWDYNVAGHETYDEQNMRDLVQSTKPAGGGGTRVEAMFDYVAGQNWQPKCAVVITDGYTPWCSPPPYPVLFVMTSGIVAPFGTTIRLDI